MSMTIRICDSCQEDYMFDDNDYWKYGEICQVCYEKKQEKKGEKEMEIIKPNKFNKKWRRFK